MRYLFLLFAVLIAAPARAQNAPFDYYVLSLGWSPSWCSQTGDARGDPQCDRGRGFGFLLHGLWPQYEQGWPDNCQSAKRPPSRAATAAMADIMGSSGLAWHEWKKHGTCSGLSADDYFATARQAYRQTRIPAYFTRLTRDVTVPPRVIEDAFIEANPQLTRDKITVTCDGGRIAEVRICLTPSLEPRPCAPDTAQDCRNPGALLEPVR